MSGLNVIISTPAANGIVGRNLRIAGEIGRIRGHVDSVSIELGAGGPTVAAHLNNWSWSWQGEVPRSIRPGQGFTITVRASGLMLVSRLRMKPNPIPDPEPEPVDVDGERAIGVVLENIVPVISLAPVQSPMVVPELPFALNLAGSASEGGPPPYGVQQVQYQLDDGPLATVDNPAGDWSSWTLPLSLTAGEHLLSVRASDVYGSVTVVTQPLTVYGYALPTSTDPQVKKTLSGVPSTSSITSWTRLEPQCQDADIDLSAGARVFDPLWMLTRQWQVGEFQAEDAGTPVQARVRATTATLTRCHFGEMAANTQVQAPVYDPLRMPLETLVEQRRMRPADATDARMLPLAVEAGLHFLRMLELDTAAKAYRHAFSATYALQPLSTDAARQADAATVRQVSTLVGRAPDARRLASALRPHGSTPIVFDASLKIAPADEPAVRLVVTAWLAWYDGLFAEPAGTASEAWNPDRLEHALAVSTRLSADPFDEVTYSAREFDGGALDWSSFDLDLNVNMGTVGDRSYTALNETTVPAPVSFRGMPAARFWEMEDARLAYGLMPVGPTDLAQMMLIEYASSYGNDWFVVPLTVPVGSVTRVDSLVVTDTFGVRSLLRPIGDPALPRPNFAMWQADSIRRAGEVRTGPSTNRFFLPPTVGRTMSGGALEDVLFLRDEMANMAWSIERSTESPIEQAAPRCEGADAVASEPPRADGALPRYRLSSDVAPNWIPWMPVQLDGGDGKRVSRLKRGAVLQSSGKPQVHEARGEVLERGAERLLFDEEVPREGLRVTKQRTLARWTDGSTWLWTGLQKRVGRGEGSSGLHFDAVEEPREPPSGA